VHLDLPDRQVHLDAKALDPASDHPAQAFQVLDKSVSPASDSREDASALPAAATAEVLQTPDFADAAASNALPGPDAAAPLASEQAAPPMGEFQKTRWATLVVDEPVPAHCSDAVQSALPAADP
jgi:hypothetical protein